MHVKPLLSLFFPLPTRTFWFLPTLALFHFSSSHERSLSLPQHSLLSRPCHLCQPSLYRTQCCGPLRCNLSLSLSLSRGLPLPPPCLPLFLAPLTIPISFCFHSWKLLCFLQIHNPWVSCSCPFYLVVVESSLNILLFACFNFPLIHKFS